MAALGVAGCNGFFTAVDVKTAVFPKGEFCEFLCADQFRGAQCVEEAVAEEFGDGGQRFAGHGMETALFVEESVGGKDMEVGMKDEEFHRALRPFPALQNVGRSARPQPACQANPPCRLSRPSPSRTTRPQLVKFTRKSHPDAPQSSHNPQKPNLCVKSCTLARKSYAQWEAKMAMVSEGMRRRAIEQYHRIQP